MCLGNQFQRIGSKLIPKQLFWTKFFAPFSRAFNWNSQTPLLHSTDFPTITYFLSLTYHQPKRTAKCKYERNKQTNNFTASGIIQIRNSETLSKVKGLRSDTLLLNRSKRDLRVADRTFENWGFANWLRFWFWFWFWREANL